MKILWMTNIPSPYRVNFFNSLSEKIELLVIFDRMRTKKRNKNWLNNRSIRFKYEENVGIKIKDEYLIPVKLHIKKILNSNVVVVSNPFSPTGVLTIMILRFFKKVWFIETDGGNFKSRESRKLKFTKKMILKNASKYFSTGENHNKYYLEYEISLAKISKYHFTSMYSYEHIDFFNLFREKKRAKSSLGLEGKKIILFSSRFIKAKGIDLFLSLGSYLNNDYLMLMIGGNYDELDENQKKIVKESNKIRIDGFIDSTQLLDYYRASDITIFPTHSDVWGLVLIESLASGTPVICSNKSGSALEVIENNYNGFIIDNFDVEAYAKKIHDFFVDMDLLNRLSVNSLLSVKKYTIENMVKEHLLEFETYLC